MLKGSTEPRIYTPPLRELTPETSLGFDVCDFAEKILHVELIPWQRWFFVHALEIIGDFSGDWRFRFRTIVSLIGRQNGKTFVSKIYALYYIYILQAPLVIGTAQDLSTAEDTWAEALEEVDEIPELAEELVHVYKTNGKSKAVFTGGREYRVKATTRKATRGKTANLIVLDELREHTNFAAWGATTKTTLAKKNAQVLCISNAGDSESVVLRYIRAKAHIAIGDPDGTAQAVIDAMGEPDLYEGDDDTNTEDMALGFFEWSADPKAKPYDRHAWAQANPSMNHSELTERTLAAAFATDPEDVWRTECLCQWIEAKIRQPFIEGSWEAGKELKSKIAPDAKLYFGLDVSADRRHTSIAVCGLRSDRTFHIEVVAYESGIEWTRKWFETRAGQYGGMYVALQSRGAPSSGLVDILNAIDGVTVIKCEGANVGAWTGAFFDGISAALPDADSDSVVIHHRPQAVLDMAAEVAQTKKLGDAAFAFDRAKSKVDISPLVAAMLAHGAAHAKKPVASAYEDEEHTLLTLD